MKIIKGSIFFGVRDGRLGLLIPEFSLSESEIQEVPDVWFCRLLHAKSYLIPAKNGFLYLNRTGYEANKDLLEKNLSFSRGFTWKDFENDAEAHFSRLEHSIQRMINKKKRELEELTQIST
jgi:hypothetical protein